MRADIIAGVTVGMILLPQALAFSVLAGLPPAMGLYAAICAAIAGALWGSSTHLHSGPTNTASILTLSVLLPIATPGTSQFFAAVGLIAVMAGVIRLALGLARLGMLVNFVSDSVAVGFTAGAGILIISNQLGPLLRIGIAADPGLVGTLWSMLQHVGDAHVPTFAVGLGTIAAIFVLQRLSRRWPAVLISVASVTLVAWLLGAEGHGVQVLGELPRSLPPPAALPFFDLGLIGRLANGALALAIIGMVEASAIARAVATHSHQHLDSNQEFVGQGLANICAGLFSGYPCSGSFNRSVLSYQAGAQTALANVVSGLFLLSAMFLLGPPLAHLPRAVLSGALILTAWSMIDRRSMARIWRSARAEAAIMLVTLAATLLLPLQFAVLLGVLMSLGYYILRTSMPRVVTVLPDEHFRHWRHQPGKPICPQLGVIAVLGDLYFGAVHHVEEHIYAHLQRNTDQRFLLLRMHSVQRCDISGIRTLENILQLCRDRGGDLFFVRVHEPVLQMMRATGFYEQVGADHFLSQDTAIDELFHKVLDPAVCIYECEVRAFRECQNLPKRILPTTRLQPSRMLLASSSAPSLMPHELWQQLHTPQPPLVVDVREPREFDQGHIPQARLIPLPRLLTGQPDLPKDRRIVLVCRSGRRSAMAAAWLLSCGYTKLAILQGGMLAWESTNLLEAVA
jgi:SulP family sulfate permease